MSRNWTKEQLDAITKDGTNIIVSAGAGSGKTAVLTERVIRKLKSGININSLLVLTFTNAAAHEMKERIRENLQNEASLKEQLSLLDSSYITTFDSFALSIVKKYHYILNVSPNINICEASVLMLEKASIMDSVFDDLYAKKDPHFLKLIGDLCVKDDQIIKNNILRINDKLDMKYDRDLYLSDYIDNMFDESKIDKDIDAFMKLIKNKRDNIKNLLDEIGNYVDSDYYDVLSSILSPLLESKTYEEYRANLNIELPRVPKNSDEDVKKWRSEINEIIKYLSAICTYNNVEKIKESINSTKDYIMAIMTILKEFDKQIKKYKYDNDLYEFADIANLSIKIIKENDDIREEIKNTFNEIMVDEYQDTNDLQEAFISLISNNNVYMVGDVKQSIYRFRNANPDIFKTKYETFKNSNQSIKIDLNKNFRSRSDVLNDINIIFNDIMDLNFGGADYKKEHNLQFGNVSYNNEGKTIHNNNLEIYNYPYDKESEYKKEEIEIFLIANDIKNKIKSHYQVMDANTKSLRDVTYSDFAILLDRSTLFDLYKKIFTYMNIPINVLKDESISTTSDILVIKSFLKLILCFQNNIFDNEFKYAFMSVGRSFLFEYTDDELFNYLTNDEYSKTNLYQKASQISKLSNSISLDSLLSLLISEFKIVENIIKIGNVNEMINRLDYLQENARSLSKMGYNLEKFIEYLDANFNDESDMRLSLSSDNYNACQLMTIHKSKGLEFNICYYPGLYSSFNIRDLNEMFYYDTNYGIVSPYFDEGIANTIYKVLLKEKYIKEEIEEKIRLFYVALTRCREKMIVLASLNNDDIVSYKGEDGLVELSYRLEYRSFRDILLSIYDNIRPFIKNIDLNDYVLSHDYNILKNDDYKRIIKPSDKIIRKEAINIASKAIKESSYSKKTNELLDKETEKILELGNTVHKYLENLDFKNPNFNNMDSYYINKIQAFLNQDILGDLRKSNIYKEYEFIFIDQEEERHGIIDLIIEYEDHIKIIDYKLKDIDKDEYVLQLKGYQKYIQTISSKRVELYLYSIIDERYKVVSE